MAAFERLAHARGGDERSPEAKVAYLSGNRSPVEQLAHKKAPSFSSPAHAQSLRLSAWRIFSYESGLLVGEKRAIWRLKSEETRTSEVYHVEVVISPTSTTTRTSASSVPFPSLILLRHLQGREKKPPSRKSQPHFKFHSSSHFPPLILMSEGCGQGREREGEESRPSLLLGVLA